MNIVMNNILVMYDILNLIISKIDINDRIKLLCVNKYLYHFIFTEFFKFRIEMNKFSIFRINKNSKYIHTLILFKDTLICDTILKILPSLHTLILPKNTKITDIG